MHVHVHCDRHPPRRRYTANLAAFFTRDNYLLHGPQTFQDLRAAAVCVAEPTIAPVRFTQTGTIVTPPKDMTSLDERYKWCHDRLKDGTVVAWLSGRDVLQLYILQDCERGADLALSAYT